MKPPDAENSESSDSGANSSDLVARIATLEAEVASGQASLAQQHRIAAEAHEQQTAVSDVLQIISSGQNDLARVLDFVISKACVLCGADSGFIWYSDGSRLSIAETHGFTPEERKFVHGLNFALDNQDVPVSTAMAEVLQVISNSPNDLENVLGQVLGIAARLCESDTGLIWQERGGRFCVAASYGMANAEVEFSNSLEFRHDGSNVVSSAAFGATQRVDFAGDELSPIEPDSPAQFRFAHRLRQQAHLLMPLNRTHSFSGVFSLMRAERRPFSDRDVALVGNFADHALIAIENSRLFKELEESNREVNAALEQQTAVAAVLQTISKSAFDLEVKATTSPRCTTPDTFNGSPTNSVKA